MKKGILILVAAAIIVVGIFLVINQQGAQAFKLNLDPSVKQESADSTPTPIPPVIASNEINASGRLVPAEFLDLSFQVEGTVVNVLVEEGQKVEKDQLIAQLGDETQIDFEIAQAQLDVLNAQKTLDDLNTNAPLIAAQANYDINAVRKELEKAIKRRTSMEYPKGSRKDIDTAYRAYKQAEDIVKDLDAYSELANTQAQAAIKAAQKERDATWANYNWLVSPYTEKEKAEQDAVVKLNQQKLDDLQKKAGLYTEGAAPQEVTIAEARLNVAKTQLAVAEEKKTKLNLQAPFSGTVVNLSIKPGQTVTAGQTILTLADTTRWRIETEDLTELNVTRIAENAKAEVRFDALPDETFTGRVVAIKNYGVVKKGDMTYIAVIEIENTDERLRWNMTSPITIMVEE